MNKEDKEKIISSEFKKIEIVIPIITETIKNCSSDERVDEIQYYISKVKKITGITLSDNEVSKNKNRYVYILKK